MDKRQFPPSLPNRSLAFADSRRLLWLIQRDNVTKKLLRDTEFPAKELSVKEPLQGQLEYEARRVFDAQTTCTLPTPPHPSSISCLLSQRRSSLTRSPPSAVGRLGLECAADKTDRAGRPRRSESACAGVKGWHDHVLEVSPSL